MTFAATQAPDATPATHLVLYDGVCGLCNRLLQFLLTHDRRGVFCFAALQSRAGMAVVEKWGGDPEDLTSFYVLADFRTPHARALTKSDAAVFVAGELGWPWKALWLAGALPKRTSQPHLQRDRAQPLPILWPVRPVFAAAS